MDLSSKYWLRRFEEEFVHNIKENKTSLMQMYTCDANLEHFLYKLLHVSGLLFGHPVRPLFSSHPEFNEWSNAEKIKYIFIESLYHVYFFKNKYRFHEMDDTQFSEFFSEATASITSFYLEFEPETAGKVSLPPLFNRATNAQRKLEKIIDKRIHYVSIVDKKFWSGIVYNTFIFLDLAYYALWFEYPSKKFHERHENIQLQVLKVIIAAFLTNDTLPGKDKPILNYFLGSAIVTANTRERINAYLKTGVSMNDIIFNPDMPPVFRLIYLEIGIMAAYADRSISEEDTKYIHALAEKLDLDEDTSENSMLMIESFIQENAANVLYLKNRYNFDLFSSSINHRLLSVVKKNKAKIIREISESKELLELLWKAQNTQLTKEEKEKVREQITDLLKTIPSLAIFMVPGGSFILPILMKILPDDLLKTSQFRN